MRHICIVTTTEFINMTSRQAILDEDIHSPTTLVKTGMNASIKITKLLEMKHLILQLIMNLEYVLVLGLYL